jgi:hypothetical protein
VPGRGAARKPPSRTGHPICSCPRTPARSHATTKQTLPDAAQSSDGVTDRGSPNLEDGRSSDTERATTRICSWAATRLCQTTATSLHARTGLEGVRVRRAFRGNAAVRGEDAIDSTSSCATASSSSSYTTLGGREGTFAPGRSALTFLPSEVASTGRTEARERRTLWSPSRKPHRRSWPTSASR